MSLVNYLLNRKLLIASAFVGIFSSNSINAISDYHLINKDVDVEFDKIEVISKVNEPLRAVIDLNGVNKADNVSAEVASGFHHWKENVSKIGPEVSIKLSYLKSNHYKPSMFLFSKENVISNAVQFLLKITINENQSIYKKVNLSIKDNSYIVYNESKKESPSFDHKEESCDSLFNKCNSSSNSNVNLKKETHLNESQKIKTTNPEKENNVNDIALVKSSETMSKISENKEIVRINKIPTPAPIVTKIMQDVSAVDDKRNKSKKMNNDYTVVSGDTLWKIALDWKEKSKAPADIVNIISHIFNNNLHAFDNNDMNKLKLGSTLSLTAYQPVDLRNMSKLNRKQQFDSIYKKGGGSYQIQLGDTISEIVIQWKRSTTSLKSINELTNALVYSNRAVFLSNSIDHIRAGVTLRIPKLSNQSVKVQRKTEPSSVTKIISNPPVTIDHKEEVKKEVKAVTAASETPVLQEIQIDRNQAEYDDLELYILPESDTSYKGQYESGLIFQD